ncbi:hypothetical protein [Bradyrhizobium sp. USDA 4504]
MELRETIDALMATEKSIVGIPQWVSTDYDGQMRWLAPLAVKGEVTPLNLIVDAYPRYETPKFTILLVYGAAVTRIDHGELERHLNHSVKGIGLPAGIVHGWIVGPHVHLWEHNRMLCKSEPPKELEFAVLLPPQVKGFENSFRWLCGIANINLGSRPLPALPNKDLLL